MNQSFNVVVEWPNGRKTEHTSVIGGGACTPDQLAQLFVDVNGFAGARAVHIEENEAPVPRSLAEAISQGRISASAKRLTPHPHVVEDGTPRKAELRGSGLKAYAPGRVQYKDGKPVELTPTPAGSMNEAGEIVQTPFQQPVTADTTPLAGQNESAGSEGESAPQGQPAARRRPGRSG